MGKQELIEAVTSGEVKLDELEQEALPAELQSLAPEEREQAVEELAITRRELKAQIAELSKKRAAHIKEQAATVEDADESLDHQIYETIRSQAGRVGLEYGDGPAY